MTTSRIIKLLSLLGFLILFAPFYDSCNGGGMKEIACENPIEVTDSIFVEKNFENTDSIQPNKKDLVNNMNSTQQSKIPFYERFYDSIDDSNSQNAYEFAYLNSVYLHESLDELINNIKSGIKKNDYSGFFFGCKNFCFLIIIFVTILIFYCAFRKNKVISKLSKINLILLLISIICLFLEGFFETITQIKWGYYSFIIINFLLLYYSKRLKAPNF